MFRRILTLIRKEIQVLLSDPQGRALLVAPVLLQVALFPLAATLEIKNATLGIYDQDRGPAAIELTQRLRAQTVAFTNFLDITGERELNDTIEQQRALAVVRIPPDFSRKIAASNSASGGAQIQIILDGRRSNSGQIAAGYIQQIVQTYQQDLAGQRGGGAATTDGATAGNATAGSAEIPLGGRREAPPNPPNSPNSPNPPSGNLALPAAATPTSAIIVRHWFNENLDYRNYILSCLVAIITTASVLIVTTLSVAREREHGTFDQLLVSPLTPEMIMIGKLVPALLIAAFQATLILIAAVFIYGVPFQGSLLILYAGILLYGLSLAGVGLFISSLCATQQQAFLGMFSFMMPAMMLSGFAAPVENMPEILQHLSWMNPVRHFIEIVKAVYLKDATVAHAAQLAWPLLVIGALTLTSAAVLFRKKTT